MRLFPSIFKTNSPSGHSPPPNTWFEWCTLLEEIDKVFKLVDIVSCYVETGHDEDYLKQESEELLKNLAALYSYSKNDETLDQISKAISVPFAVNDSSGNDISSDLE